jgi:hypothetical protein
MTCDRNRLEKIIQKKNLFTKALQNAKLGRGSAVYHRIKLPQYTNYLSSNDTELQHWNKFQDLTSELNDFLSPLFADISIRNTALSFYLVLAHIIFSKGQEYCSIG